MKRIATAALAAVALTGLAAVPANASVGRTPRACPQANGRVDAVLVANGTAYLAGQFTSLTDRDGSTKARNRLAAVDTTTCSLTSWAPNANGEVLAMAVSGSTLYVGGDFTTVNGQSSPRLAALDTGSGAVRGSLPVPDRTVRTLAVSGGRLYAGGDFTHVGSASRSKVAAVVMSTGALDQGWNPKASHGKVTALHPAADGATIYVGGSFTSLGGNAAAHYLARVTATTGAVDASFLPRPDFNVLAITADSRGVYVGGGGAGGHLGIYNLNGSLQRPVYQTDGGVQAVAVDGNSLYAGGHFGAYCVGGGGAGKPFICDNPLSRRKVLEVALDTGALTSWAPVLNSAHGVFGLDVDPTTHDLWMGGDFTTLDGSPRARVAVLG